jgi:aspartyl-tRNA(Asn)/glutamyl-tRNA(Gln) amidotransferase subunit B
LCPDGFLSNFEILLETKAVREKYEAVIGLECHIQLLTKTKMYSSEIAEYGGSPNTHVSVITLGHPGTLPAVNEKAIEFAVRLGLAVKADIRHENQFARKNYFYADLPKGYQITQDKTPICNGGFIECRVKGGEVEKVRITRIHMEEDSGKSMHDIDPFYSLVDLNRAGTPLLEMVTEPDLRSGEEAYAYLTEVRKLVRYLGICDGNMEEGSLRCDANISVRIKGSHEFGRKVEVKNMNSFRNVQRAIDHEIERQIGLIEEGKTVVQDTRSFDATKGTTFSMRSKESANDYRYFPEPDLQPVFVTREFIEKIQKELPALPSELLKVYTGKFGLSEYDAMQLLETQEESDYFNELVLHTQNYKSAANWIIGPVRSWLNEQALDFRDFRLEPAKIGQIILLIDEGRISVTAATQRLFPELMKSPDKSPDALAVEFDLIQNSDDSELKRMIDEALKRYPEKISEYRSGKSGLLGLFVGEAMKLSKGKADPRLLNKLVKEALEKKED